MKKSNFLTGIFSLPLELYRDRELILKLAKNDFKTKYAGSYLGIIWAFVQPIVTILVYWFVFSTFRAGAVDGVHFAVYLVAGIIPWFFFQDGLNSGTNAMLEYSYLVKKVVFKISVLPIIKIISAFIVHVFFVFFAILLAAFYGYYPDLYLLQLLYYFVCIFFLLLGLCYATSAIVIFFRDLSQIINIILQVGVWMTPIMWDISLVDEKFHWIFKLNPIYYIVIGYRDSIINKVGFWEHPVMSVYFWVFAIAVFGIGATIFKRLKVHFADVL